MDDWEAGERHLPYTMAAVSVILLLGAVIVPMTISASEPLATSQRTVLANRYVEAIAQVPGSAEPVPTPEQAAKTFGVSGGKGCSEPIPKLHRAMVARRPGGASAVDKVAVQRLRVVMRVYCPGRDARYAAWLTARAA